MSWFNHKLVIDRTIWRCAGHLYGTTALLNDYGFMCCLGQACRQQGYSDEKLLNVYTPQYVVNKETYLTKKHPAILGSKPIYNDTEFSDRAIAINDNECYSRPRRELELYLLGKKHGIFIQFVGQYKN